MQSDCKDCSLKSFINGLGFESFNLDLVNIAFTHCSYTKENNEDYLKCYERLEFLGDAVLKMVVTEYLYSKYSSAHEGELTKIRSIVVSDEILFKLAQKLNIERFIRVSSAEERCGGRKLESIQACVMEALFGALYLSSDKIALNNFIIKELDEFITDAAQNRTVYNAKAVLQEYTQAKAKELPVYSVIKESGADHSKTFSVQVSFAGEVLASADGKSKKHAEQQAAYAACKKLGIIEDKINE